MVELGASRWFHEEDLAFVFFVWEEADVVVFGVTFSFNCEAFSQKNLCSVSVTLPTQSHSVRPACQTQFTQASNCTTSAPDSKLTKRELC